MFLWNVRGKAYFQTSMKNICVSNTVKYLVITSPCSYSLVTTVNRKCFQSSN